ncbi:asparaginyl-tRNA synthetase [Hydrogenoanaerobacterium saccharovorans]|uniref:Asparagine--tRNA ligase n=1 Tax=Hydrogenoanaerobacterium saccharovorans TaxID=474960 RepID=A0A1H7ZYD7_9FIRM|nr:asparagine--tRNA ligase [Hydrogenoanaerobacterium saccharovorans]RPF48297.1 asparaginyl-tRNA synthetase [Hydrogenoanaerobacterium saccharovorans]SEM63331.1 asparaginyl-tRNA synthetase [Hydrogenoanaerobacterium saccharovorans]
MQRTEIKWLWQNATELADKQVTVGGWVKTIRDSKQLGFIELNDGSNFNNLQIVFEDSKIDNFKDVAKFNVGAAIIVTGAVVLTPNAKQPLEIHAQKIELEGASAPDYPLQKKRHSLEYLRSIAHLRPRTNTFAAVFRVRSVAAYAIHKFFNERGFVYAHTPLITGSDCEGAGEMFRITTLDAKNPPLKEDGSVDFSQDFFGKMTCLTVSGQLEAECMAMAFAKVYTFGPTFRAENSNTARHAAEFWMIEPEIAFADLDDDMQLAQDMIKYVLKYVMEQCPAEMKFFNDFYDPDKALISRLTNLVDSDFGKVTYTEAVKLLEEHKDEFDYPVYWGCDLQTEHERYLTEKIFKKPVFVTDYPKEIKAFYMRMNDDNKTVAAMDLLVPGVGEIIGGSQREERLDVLLSRMEELDLKADDYSWYLDLRRYGGTKHAGYGLGFERLIMYMTGISNIRDVLPFPRTTGSAEY